MIELISTGVGFFIITTRVVFNSTSELDVGLSVLRSYLCSMLPGTRPPLPFFPYFFLNFFSGFGSFFSFQVLLRSLHGLNKHVRHHKEKVI